MRYLAFMNEYDYKKEGVNVKIEREDDHWLYKVRTCGAYWLKRWVMSLGKEAELLEPEWLRNEIRCEMENMAASYQDNEEEKDRLLKE